MGLVKRTYVDQETVITAENLNDIQDAIIENEEAIEDQGEAIEGKYAKPSGGIPASDMASGVQTSLGKADTAYQKPSGGIPSTDLASGVQTSLGKADTAYQKPSGGIPSTDMASAVQTSLGKADTAYQKPSGGIPSTDLASGVQTSLGKADTALQSSDIDNTLSVTGKAADAKKTGDEISDIRNTFNQLEDNLVSDTLVRTGATNTNDPILAGTYFYLDGVLSLAKKDIGAGATFTNSNKKTVTVGEQLKMLNSGIKEVESGKKTCSIGPSVPATAITFTNQHTAAPAIVIANSENPQITCGTRTYTATGFNMRCYYPSSDTASIDYLAIWLN